MIKALENYFAVFYDETLLRIKLAAGKMVDFLLFKVPSTNRVMEALERCLGELLVWLCLLCGFYYQMLLVV